MDAASALAAVTLFALDDDSFRQEWESAVRAGTDAVCAEIAGARMAGRTAGGVDWHAPVPYPLHMDPAAVELAYRHAVRNAAAERLEKMSGRPPGGTG